MTITNDLVCLTCGDTGPDIEFPIFPLTGAPFGSICVRCDTESPWLASPLACVDCDSELTEATAYGNRKYGEPRCEDCHEGNN
jgi:hypothetical protein